jgi:pimeloyl-ACP methyl ester carboxylesterase
MNDDFFTSRRLLLGGAAIGAASQLGLTPAHGLARSAARTGAIAANVGTLKTIAAGDLDIGYAESGPSDGLPVLLLHGWPYDIYSYEEVAPLLAAAGFRVIVPWVRGHGTMRFKSADTPRNGEQAVLAVDTVLLMDALRMRQAVVAGYDWGARTACNVAALWPDRVKALISVSGYLIVNRAVNQQPLTPSSELSWWYQFYFATERGRAGYQKYRRELARLIWQQASPQWHFDDATFLRTAAALDNVDHVDVVIHNYRWRLGLAQGETRFDSLERRLMGAPEITVPSITLEGDANGAPHPEPATYSRKFTGRYEHRNLSGGVGHNLPQEAPEAFANAVIDATRF